MTNRRQSTDAVTRSHSARWLWCGAAGVVFLVAVILAFISVRKGPDHVDNHSSDHANKQADAESAALVGISSAPPPSLAPEGMAWIPGGTFWMGCDDCDMPDTTPVHLVSVDGFWIDRTPVTNAQFAAFVKATSYVTTAERKPDPKDYPDVDPAKLVAGSAVFTPPSHDVALDDITQW